MLRRIDVRTNSLGRPIQLKQGTCCVAAGGGFVWVAVNPDAAVWKLSSDGRIMTTIKVPARVESIRYRDGALWVADGDAGAVIRIDPTTNGLKTYRIGHHVTGIDVHDGLVAVGVRPSDRDITSGLRGRIVRVAVKAPTLFWSGAPTDPVLYTAWDAPQNEFHYATCAKLFNYPDVSGSAGKEPIPEVASGLPKATDGGRTYTFSIREGYRFSPPSNEPVTAKSFRHEIERVLSPKMPWFEPTAADIVGAAAYHSGKAQHLAGVSARGDTLVIRYAKPMPNVLRILALNLYCAVPASTPVASHGIAAPIPSAGPYYLVAHSDSVALLKRNPNYHGPRPQHLDAIVYQLGADPAVAATKMAKGSIDYILENDPALAPETVLARRAGRRYRLSPDATASTQLLVFNTRRPLFASPRLRRAVAYAVDRRSLSSIDTALPATRLLSPRLHGFDPRPLYPLEPDLKQARNLMSGERVHAVFETFDPALDPQAAALASAVRQQLSAIGIRLTILPLTFQDFSKGTVAEKFARADLAWAGAGAADGDPVSYLMGFADLLPEQRAEIARIAALRFPEREVQAAALAAKIDRQALVAVYEQGAIPELVSARLGCIVHQPEYAGIDLAALCLREGKS